MPTTDEAIATSKAEFQKVVDGASTAALTTLRQQLVTKAAQMKTLQGQIQVIRQQIDDAEGEEVKRAKRMLEMLDRPDRTGPGGRF